jgi:glycosyltransferase involved in cell wall biosynthesis
MTERRVRYSICVCNYNMADTIERAMESVLCQISDECEVLVIDDGSDDDSVERLAALAARYPTLRYVALKRDRHRLLGETRNVSIREARGEYVLPQVDCDDVYETCFMDFINVFHQLERCLGKDIYLKGDKLNMGRRAFLLGYGPYRNTFKEDRDMWLRLAEDGVFVPLFHAKVFTRMPKTKKEKLHRLIYKTWAHLLADFRSSLPFSAPYRRLFAKDAARPLVVRALRCLMAPFAHTLARTMDPLPVSDMMKHGNFQRYWSERGGTFETLMRRHGCKPDFEQLSADGRRLFQD